MSHSNSVVDERKLNVLDLFCGCGGMSKGLQDAGLNVVAGIDIWDKAVASYSVNLNHTSVCEDITNLAPAEFEELYLTENPTIDIIVGGPPCQGFSIAGKRDIKDPRNSLFMEYVKYLEHFRPKAFMMENVMGILSMKNKDGVKVITIILGMLEMNYVCTICKLYASEFRSPPKSATSGDYWSSQRLEQNTYRTEPSVNERKKSSG